MVQEIKWWPCKYEDVSFPPTTHVKSTAQWIPFDILVLERQRQGDPWESLASWPSWNSKSYNNQWKILSTEQGGRSVKKDRQGWSLASTVFTCTHTHTHTPCCTHSTKRLLGYTTVICVPSSSWNSCVHLTLYLQKLLFMVLGLGVKAKIKIFHNNSWSQLWPNKWNQIILELWKFNPGNDFKRAITTVLFGPPGPKSIVDTHVFHYREHIPWCMVGH